MSFLFYVEAKGKSRLSFDNLKGLFCLPQDRKKLADNEIIPLNSEDISR